MFSASQRLLADTVAAAVGWTLFAPTTAPRSAQAHVSSSFSPRADSGTNFEFGIFVFRIFRASKNKVKPKHSETKTGTKFVRKTLPRLHVQLPSESAQSFSYSFRRGFRRGFRSGFRTDVRPGSNSGFRFEVYKKNPLRCSGGLGR